MRLFILPRCVVDEMSACDIGCDEYGYPVRRGPVVTEQMVAFGKAAFFARHLGDMDGMIEAIYIAMHTARPLSEGPV